MKKSIVILLAAAGVLMSCAKEVSEPIPSPMKEEASESTCFRIPVRMERAVTKGSDDEFEFCFEDDTKVNISSSTGAATWTAGDQIAFCQSNGVNSNYLTADVDPETSEISVILDDGYSPANYAIYPASAAGSNMTTPTVVYADSYDLDNIADEETFCMAPMVAINDGGDLDFYHVGGVLRLSLVGVPTGTRKIRVTFNGISYVTGTYTVSNPGTSSTTTTVSSGSHNFVDFRKFSEDFSSETYLNIPLPQGSYGACTGMTVTCYDSSLSTTSSHSANFPWLSLGRARGKKAIDNVPLDLSRVNPLTGASMSRETANCYIVTEPGEYCLPLFYGNAIVNGSNNCSTAAPAKGSVADKGVFVNSYDATISDGNIKTDLENAGYSLNTSGGNLIWSTESAMKNALVIVDSKIDVNGDIVFLNFSVPSDRFQEGSALIGVLKDGSTTEYVWAWHIWITNGRVVSTETYTNYQSVNISMLNRPLGGVGSNSLVNVYYQYGMPFPLPPSNGSTATATLYDASGTYTFNHDSGNTITTLGKALSKPYLPRWHNGFFNDASGTAQNFYNMWDATQTAVNSDKAVVKTIYDPSPAGMSVPRLNAFTGFTTTGADVSSGAPTNCNVVGSFSQGWKFKKNSSDPTGSLWTASGFRGNNSAPGFVGSYGYYWSACPNSSTGGYYLRFMMSSVSPLLNNGRFWGLSVRPALL